MSPTSTRRRLPTAERREEFLNALAAELGESNWHDITVSKVVRRAEASQGLFYRYFRDLDSAFIALVDDRVWPTLAEAGTRLDLSVSSGAELQERLTRWFTDFAGLVVDQGPVIRAALLAAPAGTGAAADHCRHLIEQLRAWGAGLLGPVNGREPYRAMDATLVSHMVVGMTLQCAQLGVENHEIKAWASEMAAFETWGLISRAQPDHATKDHGSER